MSNFRDFVMRTDWQRNGQMKWQKSWKMNQQSQIHRTLPLSQVYNKLYNKNLKFTVSVWKYFDCISADATYNKFKVFCIKISVTTVIMVIIDNYYVISCIPLYSDFSINQRSRMIWCVATLDSVQVSLKQIASCLTFYRHGFQSYKIFYISRKNNLNTCTSNRNWDTFLKGLNWPEPLHKKHFRWPELDF